MHLSSAYAVENPRLKKNEKKTADMVQTNMLAFMKSFCQQPAQTIDTTVFLFYYYPLSE